jgi:cytochrome o ubiquinol oxidase subunit 3
MVAHGAHVDAHNRTIFGFWLYLLSDFILFAVLFATYAVLQDGVADGPSAKSLFNQPLALLETLILLVSNFTCGLGLMPAYLNQPKKVAFWFGVTFVLGFVFLLLEWNDWSQLIVAGNSWRVSAFLSAFFTLVGTHAAHLAVGLLWILVLMVPVLRRGMNPVSFRRLSCLRMFWHFLNLVWVFIFSIVYLMGGK